MEKTDAAPAKTVILDAGPLIHLDELGCLILLTDFQERMFLPLSGLKSSTIVLPHFIQTL